MRLYLRVHTEDNRYKTSPNSMAAQCRFAYPHIFEGSYVSMQIRDLWPSRRQCLAKRRTDRRELQYLDLLRIYFRRLQQVDYSSPWPWWRNQTLQLVLAVFLWICCIWLAAISRSSTTCDLSIVDSLDNKISRTTSRCIGYVMACLDVADSS